MAGTKQGAQASVAKLLARDPDHFKKIGQLGGKAPKSKPAGFAAMSYQRVSEAGRKGGKLGHPVWTEERRERQSKIMIERSRRRNAV